MQFWPRKRAKRVYPRVRSWPDGEGFLGFAGYKAGMTHLMIKDNNPNSQTKGQEIFIPVSVVECPPLKIHSLRFYKNSSKGLVAASEVQYKVDKELARRTNIAKNPKDKLAEIEKQLDDYVDMKVIVYTQPKLTGIGKKKPDIFELGIGGKSLQDKLNFIKEFIGKEITVSDVFKAGEQVDVRAVTKGKGFQGTTKRYGTFIRGRKTEKEKRGIGTLGPWHPAHVLYTVPQPGKMGFHTRTEYNKWLVKIGDKPEEINPKGGFLRYGLIKNNYVLIKGGIAGSRNRIVRFNKPMRPKKQIPSQAPEITYTSLESKQAHR